MFYSLEFQAQVFLQSVLLGTVVGLVYGIFRVLRNYFHTGMGMTLFMDILFWLLALGSFFGFGLNQAAGQSRAYIIIGTGMGLLLYFHTFAPLIEGVLYALLHLMASIMRFISKWWKKINARISILWRKAKENKKNCTLFKKFRKTTSIFKRKGIK